MTKLAKTSFGRELWMGPVGGPLVKFAELRSVTPPKPKRDTEDATTHDSDEGAEEFIPHGTYDPGQVTAIFNYIMGSDDDLRLIDAFADAELRDWKIVLKTAAGTGDQTFSGAVLEYGPDDMPVKGLQTSSLMIKVSGPVTQ
jgi:hypothetical protein